MKLEERVKTRLHIEECPVFLMEELRTTMTRQILEMKQQTYLYIEAHPKWNDSAENQPKLFQ
jgi:hypothetical protein